MECGEKIGGDEEAGVLTREEGVGDEEAGVLTREEGVGVKRWVVEERGERREGVGVKSL